jgi:hypothetical protein
MTGEETGEAVDGEAKPGEVIADAEVDAIRAELAGERDGGAAEEAEITRHELQWGDPDGSEQFVPAEDGAVELDLTDPTDDEGPEPGDPAGPGEEAGAGAQDPVGGSHGVPDSL